MAKSEKDEISGGDVAELKALIGEPVEVVEPEAEPEPEPVPDSAYYSPSTGGFYHDRVHGGVMPDDVIDIGHDAHRELMEAQGSGKMIVPGPAGTPIAVERPGPTPEQRAAQTTRFRDATLRDTAWRIAEDEPDREAWIAYRAKVRSIDLADPVWPDAPA